MSKFILGAFDQPTLRSLALGNPRDVYLSVRRVTRGSAQPNVARGDMLAHLWPSQIGLLAAMAASNGRPLTHGELSDHLYCDRADGGPDDANVIVRRFALAARTRLAALGVRLPVDTLGYRLEVAS